MRKFVVLGITLGLGMTPSWADDSTESRLVQGRPLTTQEKLSDLQQLVSVIKAGYGPLRYKAQVKGLNVDTLYSEFASRVEGTTNAQFYYLISEFVARFQDSHFGAVIPTDRTATLPFATDLVEGRAVIESINRAKLPEKDFPFEKGDEIVEIDGRATAEVISEIQKLTPAGYELTARRRATMRLTNRPGAVLPVPTGDVSLKIRHGRSPHTDTVKLKWNISGKGLDEANESRAFRPLNSNAHRALEAAVGTPATQFDQLSTFDLWEDLERNRAEPSFRCSGSTRINIPTDATVIMREPFVAYYHPTEFGNVGYLRIPHYYWQDDDGKAQYEIRFRQYEYAVSVLEQNTVGLVIDQDHNCGGSVAFLHRMASLFLTRPADTIQFELLATKEQVIDFEKWMNSEEENTLLRKGLEGILDLLVNAWSRGDFMTAKTCIEGMGTVRPHPVHYTKPIVMLIDEMSGSGGDAFPALLGGVGRARLIGTRTMGAGGHVVDIPGMYFSQVGLRMTKSLFYRPDGVAVENNGAVPHVPYSPTWDDFKYGYRGYQAFYLQQLRYLIETTTPSDDPWHGHPPRM